MFKPGDWIFGLDEYKGEKFLTHAVVIAVTERYYICAEQVNKEDELKSVKGIIESIYEQYEKDGGLENSNIIMLKKENTFATEQEAREVLEVME